MTEIDATAVRSYLLDLQDRICDGLSALDGNDFHEDAWDREAGGGGRTRVLSGGPVFEQAGVNFSHVFGANLPATASERRPELAGRGFQALGVSLVVHPRNPYVPTSHANVRFFMAEAEDAEPVWWFGGGFDLTPFYPFDEDCRHWHQVAHDAVAPWGEDLYPRFKTWCDEYFYLPHRGETRGIGGLFFDDYERGGFGSAFAMMRSVGDGYMRAYAPLGAARPGIPHTQPDPDLHLYRRGRSVECHLLYDRGTKFGIQSGGRTESILMSMPPLARWEYDYQVGEATPEAELTRRYLQPREWL